jgi:peptidoglycan-N-acetylglucosamine deacetylase
MAPRWSWDFEDENKARKSTRAQTPPGPPLEPPEGPRGGPASRAVQVRRRRAGAAAVLVLLAVVVAIVAGASGSHSPHVRPATHTARVPKAVHVATESRAQLESMAVNSVLAYTPFVKEGGTSGRDVALTFDDGPGPYTPQVLSVLERYHVRATFFEIGKMLRYFSQSTVREIEDGDVIGDHTESHPAMATLSAHDQYEELFEQIARIELLGGRRPTLFRPPYGSFDATTFHELAKLHLLMVLWSVDTDDYLQPGVSEIVERAVTGAHPGAIILMHDAGGVRTQTIEALPSIIKQLRAQGYRLVTIPQLLHDDPPPHGQPLPTSLAGD